MSALPSSSMHTHGTRGKDDPWASQPTLEVYPALGSIFNALKLALAKTATLLTDPAAHLKLAQLIVNGNNKLCAAARDSCVAANNNFMSFWHALWHLLHELHPETYLKYRWKWDWLTAVPYDHPFFGFQEAASMLVFPDAVPAPPSPPPTPKKPVPSQAPPVAGPSRLTCPPVVPPRAAPDPRPPQDPAQMEGLYCLPTPGYLLAELQAPLLEGYAPLDWVRPPCGSCAALGIICTGGNFLHGVCCDNCNNQNQPSQLPLMLPLKLAGISSLIIDLLMLRGMTRVVFALAEDQYKLLEAKMGTLSLILSRVYSDEG
ncbi:hypothetical protein H1R20_g12953, partial [Candolleomyces eurysporus]